MGDNIAELDAIQSNFLAFTGETDGLVPAEIAAKIVEIVASKDKEFRIAPGGHMGVIIGSKAQNAVWAESAQLVGKRSGKARIRIKKKTRSKPKSRHTAPATAKTRPRRKL